MNRWRWPPDSFYVQVISFIGAAAAVLAQSDAVPTPYRVIAGAISAGCVAVLGLKKRPV